MPFEFTNAVDTVSRYIDDIERLAKRGAPPKQIDLAPLRTALRALGESSRHYEEAFARAESKGFATVKQPAALNELLYKSERRLTNEQGLPRRPWFKHQIYAPGFYTGYGVKTIPGVREAIEQKLWAEVEPQMKTAAAAIDALRLQVEAATRLLDGK